MTIGQELIIDKPTVDVNDENIYTVQKGDTLYSISVKNGVTVNEIKSLNNLSSNALSVGQKLLLPVKDGNSAPNDNNTYVVKSGDSLYSIARKYDVTVDTLKKANNLTSNLLSIGQKLVIPSSNSNSTTYTVQLGDNLYSIARRFGTTVDELKKLNNLTSNLLSIGQILIIQ